VGAGRTHRPIMMQAGAAVHRASAHGTHDAGAHDIIAPHVRSGATIIYHPMTEARSGTATVPTADRHHPNP